MRYVLDTNIISLLLRRNEAVTKRYRLARLADDTIIGCPIVWYELQRGLLAQDAQKQIGQFATLFATFIWQEYARNDWELAADLWRQRRVQGLPIADADLFIAVFARNRSATLDTDNEKDFAQLGVNIENWTA